MNSNPLRAWSLIAAGLMLPALGCAGVLGAGSTDDAAGAADASRPEPDVDSPSPDAGAVEDAESPTAAISTAANLKVAFIGDQGAGVDARAVLRLIKAEGTDMVLHQGDFDYNFNPTRWDDMISEELGDDFPYFASIGNHDVDSWAGSSGYQQKLADRLSRMAGASCKGDLGVQSACSYKGLFFILSGVDHFESQYSKADQEQYIKDGLAAQNGMHRIWKVCSWHKNMRDMQVGGKGDRTGWGVYQACQDGGAIIATGHEHSYSRTRTLTALGNRSQHHGAVGSLDLVEVDLGRTFVFVSGMGGAGIRDYHGPQPPDPWWGTIYTSNLYWENGQEVHDYDYVHGALFITFNVDGDPNKAIGYFKNTLDQEIDRFDVLAR